MSKPIRKQARILSKTGGEAKRFTVKELQDACKKMSPAYDSSAVVLRKKTKRYQKIAANHGNNAAGSMGEPDAASQMRVIDSGVNFNAKKYNEYKAMGDRLEDDLKHKRDTLTEVLRETTALEKMLDEDHPESKRIRELMKELKDVNERTEKKIHYRFQLNHMYQRLHKNSVSLDAYMNSMTQTLDSAEREKGKCEKMSREVEAGRNKALLELEEVKRNMSVEREERQRTMRERNFEVANAERMEVWRYGREETRKEIARSQDRRLERENQLLRQAEEYEHLSCQLTSEIKEKTKIFNVIDEAFKHIKQATGVNTLLEMINKFAHGKEHRERILLEKKDAGDKLALSKKSLESARENFGKIKENGFGDTDLSRDMINSIKCEIEEVREEVKLVKATNERCGSVLVGLRQGGMGLYQRLTSFHSLLKGDAPEFNESVTNSPTQVACDTLEMLKVTEEILGQMLEVIGGSEIPRLGPISDEWEVPAEDETVITSVTKETIETIENPNLGGSNCRIKVKPHSGSHFGEGYDSDYQSSDDEDLAAGESGDNTENVVPSRQFLKSNSGKQTGEAKRRSETEERRRKYEERIAAASEDERAALTNTAVLKKQQAEANARMARHNRPLGLPKSLSIRDDPMTKAQVFIAERPHLE